MTTQSLHPTHPSPMSASAPKRGSAVLLALIAFALPLATVVALALFR